MKHSLMAKASTLLLVMAGFHVIAQPAKNEVSAADLTANQAFILQPESQIQVQKNTLNKQINSRTKVFTPEKGITGEQVYIVRFQDQPLATYQGGIGVLAATAVNPVAKQGLQNAAKLNAQTAASKAYLSYLDQQHEDMETKMSSMLGRNLQISQKFRAAINGMTMRMTQDEAIKLSTVPGIAKIHRDYRSQLTTDRGPDIY